MDTDRNLLFGVIALQADLIDARQFIDACLLWTSRKDVPLAELLVERGWIRPADRAHVDYLLGRKIDKHGGARAGLAAIPDEVKRSLAALGDDDIQQSLAGLPVGAGAEQSATVVHVPGPAPRYSRLRLHATGGIGRVWLARDGELGRDVALKELRPERAGQAAFRARFLQEARVTGQLEHPGIVPVYELVRDGDEQVFYTMRFVNGRTLSEAARAFHRKRAAGEAEGLDLPALLNAFVTVCNTVAYAHSRGVLHRDLKGQNIILGDFGEVVVLDWGLAKRVGRSDDEPSERPGPEGRGVEDRGQTVQGQALGTPAYMAPEQAAGRLDLIDRRTDVYGLGAVLYEALTGEPPFAGPDTETVLRKVLEEGPGPPRQLWPEVPPALEALCLRALAKEPADRPAAAGDLAREVQGWQEQERRKAEEALRESEALYHSLVEALPCSIWRKDLGGRFIFANQRVCDQLGRPLDQVLGRTTFEVSDRHMAERFHRDDQRVIETGELFEDVVEHPRSGDEAPRYVHMMKTPVRDAGGAVVGIQGIAWDVTARKLAEEELRKSRERFELAVRGSQDGLWDWDLEANQVWYSPHLRNLLGYDEQELPMRPGEPVRVHPDDQDRWRVAVSGHLEGLTDHYELEYRMRHKDGTYRWVRARGVALRDAGGKAYRVAGSLEDVTQRKLAEEALRQSEERYRSVIAAMQDGIMILDADGSIRECNAAAERILGLSAEQIRGRTPHDPRWRAMREDGSPFPGEDHPPLVTLRTGRPCTDVVMGVHKPDGTLTWITINAQPLFEADGRTLAGVVASFEDVTDRKRAEELLRQTAERLARCEQQLAAARAGR